MNIKTKREYLISNYDNAEVVKKRYEEQWKIFQPFVQKYPRLCLQLDGIADCETWKKEKVKILFFLKDGYRWEKRNFIDTFVFDEIFSSEKIPSGNYDTWRTVYEWSNALRKAFGLSVCGLKNIAFMNVSKIAVDGYQSTKTRKNALEYAVFEDKAELRAQLESIAPDIVVCGNTGKYLFEILDEKAIKADGIGKNAATGRNPLDLYTVGGYVVFNAYHPSYTQTTTGEEFRELIKRNEGIFAKFHS